MNLCVEQVPAGQLHAVRNPDEADVAAGSGGADGLRHRFLGADGLNDRMRAESVGQVLDAGHALVAALSHEVGRAELQGKLLPRLVTAHGDDTLGTQLLGGEHRAEAYRAVTDDCDHLARLHVGRVGAEPAGAQHIGGRQQAGDQFVGREVRRGHQGAVGERHA